MGKENQIGTWRARSTGAKLAAGKSAEQVAIGWVFLDGPFKDDTITSYGSLSDAAIDRTIEGMRHAGWEGDNLADLSTIKGKVARLVIEEEEWNGKIKQKVAWINGLGGEGPAVKSENVVDGKQAEQLAARMKKRIQASDAARAKADAGEGNPL